MSNLTELECDLIRTANELPPGKDQDAILDLLDKTAGDAGREILWQIIDRRAQAQLSSYLQKEDPQIAALLREITLKLMDSLDVGDNVTMAIHRVQQSLTKGKNMAAAGHRNNLAKAADLLGVRTPTSF